MLIVYCFVYPSHQLGRSLWHLVNNPLLKLQWKITPQMAIRFRTGIPWGLENEKHDILFLNQLIIVLAPASRFGTKNMLSADRGVIREQGGGK